MSSVTWVVEITVSERLVKDGFDLYNNEENACEEMEKIVKTELLLSGYDPLDLEVSARVLEHPDREHVAKLKGFKNVNEYYQSTTE